MSEVLVIGHRNPDTDAICSAIGYAEFKRRTGLPEAVAARCGDTNERIDFVLRTFGVPAPRFVADVSPRVADVMQPDVLSVPPETTVAEALNLMDEHNVRMLPVLNQQRQCQGFISLFKVGKFLFPVARRLVDSRRVLASLQTLAETLGGSLALGFEAGKEEELVLMIGAMGLESFAERLSHSHREQMAVVVGDRWDIQNLAIRERVRLLIVTGGLSMEPKTLETARSNRVSVIYSPHDTLTTATLCRASIAVRYVLGSEFLSFPPEAALSEARPRATASGFLTFPVVEADGQMVGILAKTDFLKEVNRKLILVDHNELSQAVQGAGEVEILEIIDHHRIGALTTSHPILFRNEPVGSTSTIVAECFFRYGVELTPPIAGLLLAGLVSDTLNLTSPTTTPVDREVLARLEKLSGVNAREFTDKLFASGSLLTHQPAPRAIATDCKEYEENGVRFSVAQIEEIGLAQFWPRKSELMQALEAYRQTHGYNFSALLVTDVNAQSSLLLVAGDPGLIGLIDYPRLEPGLYELQDIVSRKKQLLPYLTHCLRQMPATAET